MSKTLIDPKFAQMLVCPIGKSQLIFDEDKQELISLAARLAYPIKEHVPILLRSEARQLDDDELEAFKAKQS